MAAHYTKMDDVIWRTTGEKRGERLDIWGHRATHVLSFSVKDWTERLINLTMRFCRANRLISIWGALMVQDKVSQSQEKRGCRLMKQTVCVNKRPSSSWPEIFASLLPPPIWLCVCVSGRRFSFLCSRLLSFNWEVGGKEGTHVSEPQNISSCDRECVGPVS